MEGEIKTNKPRNCPNSPNRVWDATSSGCISAYTNSVRGGRSRNWVHLRRRRSPGQHQCAGTWVAWSWRAHRRGAQMYPRRRPGGIGRCWGWTWPRRCHPRVAGSAWTRSNPSSAEQMLSLSPLPEKQRPAWVCACAEPGSALLKTSRHPAPAELYPARLLPCPRIPK